MSFLNVLLSEIFFCAAIQMRGVRLAGAGPTDDVDADDDAKKAADAHS
jgi:hypothetical protein